MLPYHAYYTCWSRLLDAREPKRVPRQLEAGTEDVIESVPVSLSHPQAGELGKRRGTCETGIV
jgi:hypothetical protein